MWVMLASLVGLLVYIYTSLNAHCGICRVRFKRKIYKVTIDNKKMYICPNCNRKYERQRSREAYKNHITQATESVKTSARPVPKRGVPVTKFIKTIQQPRGGFIKRTEMEKDVYSDGFTLHEQENIHSSLIGMAVDYLTRYMLFGNRDDAFSISLRGARIADELHYAQSLLQKVNDLDAESVSHACKLVGYDVAYRAGLGFFNGVQQIEPDADTVDNIIIMVNRAVAFFRAENVTDAGMSFEGGYTDIISSGDADYLSADTLWDMKVSRQEPNKDNTLQLVIYYLLMTGSEKYHNHAIRKIGIFNPRSYCAYRYSLENLDKEILLNLKRDAGITH